ncbi:MAG: amidohydrolase family protein [Myxococcales bacterium]|nr:amidohydrolase family protein [Myxococcales bacterium]
MPLDLPVLDAHVHFWDPRSTPRAVSTVGRLLRWHPRLMRAVGARLFPRSARRFVGSPELVMRAYLPAEQAAEQAGVDVRGVVHIQAGWEGKGPLAAVDETRWIESLGVDRIVGIVGHAAVDGASLPEVLAAHRAASARFVGVRDMTAHDPDRGVMDFSAPGRMERAAFRRGVAAVGEAGLTFDAWCYGPQLGALADALREAPATRVVLCHVGTPIGVGGPFGKHGHTAAARASILARWKDDLARVAALPNVHAKLSGLAMPVLGFGFHERATPPTAGELADRFGPLVEHALAVFGPSRCFFASNFPMDKVSASWRAVFDAYASLVAGLDEPTRRGLFHDHAARFYGLTPA